MVITFKKKKTILTVSLIKYMNIYGNKIPGNQGIKGMCQYI